MDYGPITVISFVFALVTSSGSILGPFIGRYTFYCIILLVYLCRKWIYDPGRFTLCLHIGLLILKPNFSFEAIPWYLLRLLYVFLSSRCFLSTWDMYLSLLMISVPIILSQGVNVKSFFLFSSSKNFY